VHRRDALEEPGVDSDAVRALKPPGFKLGQGRLVGAISFLRIFASTGFKVVDQAWMNVYNRGLS
jgi:hypothetical protein